MEWLKNVWENQKKKILIAVIVAIAAGFGLPKPVVDSVAVIVGYTVDGAKPAEAKEVDQK